MGSTLKSNPPASVLSRFYPKRPVLSITAKKRELKPLNTLNNIEYGIFMYLEFR